MPPRRNELEGAALILALHDALARGGDPRELDQLLAGAPVEALGSIVTGAMDRDERRRRGAHYTSEADIMKLLRSLFLDDLDQELREIQSLHEEPRRRRLATFLDGLSRLQVLDPACGCGDFLLLAYRELRRLELEAIAGMPGVAAGTYVTIEQFHGIELQEVAAQTARVRMWLLARPRAPRLADIPIRCANALRIDWRDLLAPDACAYVIGNPPFVGKQARTAEQAQDMQIVFGNAPGAKNLDYVCAWLEKATDYIAGTTIEVAYVATNSITQGQQPGLLWPLLERAGPIEIVFAHRSFPWRSAANVHVVIIGFATRARRPRRIHAYDNDGNVHITVARSINPYLVEGPRETLAKRRAPLDPTVPPASFGNMPNDGGHLLLSEDERLELVGADPGAAGFIRPFISARQFLAGTPRWCLWLRDASPAAIQRCKPIMARVEQVLAYRQASARAATRKLAAVPTRFGEIRQPDHAYVLIPRHPSERRRVVPIGYFEPDNIIADSCIAVSGASKYHFGVLCSSMHDAWLRCVGGRIKSDLRYSIELVYNNFPWPLAPTPPQREAIERCANLILLVRNAHAGSSLAKLYGRTTMPSELVSAHLELNAAVDECYGVTTPLGDSERVSLLFAMWRQRHRP
jgi:hypothetical protein